MFIWNDRQKISAMTTYPHCFCNFVLLLWKRKHFWLEFLWWTILVLQLGPNLQQKCKLQAQFHEKHVNHTGEKGCKRVRLRWKVKREWLIKSVSPMSSLRKDKLLLFKTPTISGRTWSTFFSRKSCSIFRF